VITVENGEYINFIATSEEDVTFIVNEYVYVLHYDTDTDAMIFNMDQAENTDYDYSFSSAGDEQEFRQESMFPLAFTITIDSIRTAPKKFFFHISFSMRNCNENYRLPTGWIDTLNQRLEDEKEEVTKNWEAFNADHQEWESRVFFADKGLMCQEDIPDEPKIEDYL